ncbi:MAG: class I SAM-dependent methyltransferase [Candidatus Wallbacteria bacterium]|nr:class I SAM-dependent methyltransferase [Candidatus Wallbacteria bacterium]
MDQETLSYYSENAREVFERYNSVIGGISNYFNRAFPDKCRILDIGCGSGRDLLALLKLGHDAYGIEPCRELRELTCTKFPELKGRIVEGSLPDPGLAFEGNFDALVCSAVLMHLPKEHLFDTVFSLRKLLKPGGKALISIPFSRDGISEANRDDKGRLFSDLNSDYLELLFERTGFKLNEKWINEDSLKRPGFSWVTMLFALLENESGRPIDRIESVLNRDKKDATYKLALT